MITGHVVETLRFWHMARFLLPVRVNPYLVISDMRHVCSLTPVIALSPLPSGTWWRQVLRGGFAVLVALVTAESALAQINVTAAWDPNTDGRTAGYLVEVGRTAGNPTHTIDVGPATSVVLPLPPGAVYYVSVRGYNGSRQLGPAVEEEVDLANSPGAPENFRASVAGFVATLSWRAPSLGGIASRYLLSVGTAPGASNLLSEYPLGNMSSVSGALPPGRYYARIQAGNLVGIGPSSPEVAFDVAVAPAPPAPAGVVLTAAGPALHLTWRAVPGATAYVVEAGTARGATNIGVFNVGNTTAVAANVPPGVYYVRVRSLVGSTLSAPSAEVTAQVR